MTSFLFLIITYSKDNRKHLRTGAFKLAAAKPYWYNVHIKKLKPRRSTQTMQELKYKIISSGSHGNAVKIDDIMVDCGVSFKTLRPYLYGVRWLFITHVHSDHLKASTVKQIRKLFPKIKILGNYEVAGVIDLDTIITQGTEIRDKNKVLQFFECSHNVTTHGLTIEKNEKEGNVNVIYATDTVNLNNAPALKYDYFFIESNHDEDKLKLIKRNKIGYNALAGAKRHLSTQESKAFYLLHRKERDSKWIELHKSTRFY